MNRICLYIRRLRRRRGRLWGQNHGVRISVRRGIALSVSSGVGAGLFSVLVCACLWARAVRRVAVCWRRSRQHSRRLWSGHCGRSNERRPVRRGGHCVRCRRDIRCSDSLCRASRCLLVSARQPLPFGFGAVCHCRICCTVKGFPSGVAVQCTMILVMLRIRL